VNRGVESRIPLIPDYPRGSFLLIWLTEPARSASGADEAGEHDHGEDVGNDLDIFHANVRNDALHLDCGSLSKAEQQACEHRLNRAPLAENQSSQSNESASSRHIPCKQ